MGDNNIKRDHLRMIRGMNWRMAGSVLLPQAASVSVGVCEGMALVGIDMYDKAGRVVMHGHMLPPAATAFFQAFGVALAEVGGASPGIN